MIRLTARRAVLVAAVVCAGVGAAGVVAGQAAASGGPSRPISPNPTAKPFPVPPVGQLHRSGALRASAAATNAVCGQTITASLTLNGDLFCSSGNGLIVSGASVVLNLNGHQIGGEQVSNTVGVRLTGASETVTNGVVDNFFIGVQVVGTGDTVSTVRSTFNSADGIQDIGSSTKLTNDVTYGNVSYGIYSSPNTATYSGDHELNNAHYGLFVAGGHGLTVTSNVANANGEYGILDEVQGTTLKSDTANDNGQDGIFVGVVSVIDGGGNIARGNDYGSDATPEQCFGVVCS